MKQRTGQKAKPATLVQLVATYTYIARYSYSDRCWYIRWRFGGPCADHAAWDVPAVGGLRSARAPRRTPAQRPGAPPGLHGSSSQARASANHHSGQGQLAGRAANGRGVGRQAAQVRRRATQRRVAAPVRLAALRVTPVRSALLLPCSVTDSSARKFASTASRWASGAAAAKRAMTSPSS